MSATASTSDLTGLTALAAARAIRAGEISSRALTDACLARVAARDGEVGAFAHINPDHARAEADAADQALAGGHGVGPLHGVPVAVKDLIDTADQPTENGFPALYAGRRPEHDAACVARLRAAGAVILGKTVTSPLAGPGPIKTRNPHNLERHPGTSSSGSAAAVADHMVPLALGTQTAGSVIRPAAWCGVVGYKPTYGLVSRQGVLMQSHTLDTLGVLARTVEDAALAVDVMAGPDAADPATFATSRGSLLALAQSSAPVPPLFALYKSPFWQQADAATREAYGELTEVLGSQVEEIESPLFDQAFEAMLDVMAAENAVHYGPLYDEASAQMSDNLKASIERGRTLTAERYVKAVLLRERANAVLAEHCRNYAAVLTLACAGPAPRADAAFAPNVNGIWTLIGAPAVSLPLMEVDGLPVGVQLVGARRDDGRLLRTARWLATHLATAA